ncbi:hypothetical protein CROQUDRAFT_489250 [Cronartium quercuum f. sp. fusiforme G11]|uniref:Transmembrane protein n=1 Tax=Cronartium quercuum f. sp. fusiforme G11 TaxID=708437 RepID=A0A9P6TDU3_9BASI|nr:hypothetical protein CROQUDRAFT_489250 [Cronartium quercuum f. sp. fusiforme G11]
MAHGRDDDDDDVVDSKPFESKKGLLKLEGHSHLTTFLLFYITFFFFFFFFFFLNFTLLQSCLIFFAKRPIMTQS